LAAAQEGGNMSIASRIPLSPTGSRGWFRISPFGLALPSEINSIFSLLLLLASIALVVSNPFQQILFRLPFPSLLLSIPALLMALAVLLKTASRPGPLFPRFWLLALIAICFLTVLAGLVWHFRRDLPWPAMPHALATGCLAASMMLVVRMVPVSPKSRLVYLLGPMVFIVLLGGTYGANLATLRYARQSSEGTLQKKIRRIDLLKRTHKELLGLPWDESLPENSKLSDFYASTRIAALKKILPTDRDWSIARVSKLEPRLARSYGALLDQVATTWNERSYPRMATFGHEAMKQEEENGAWSQHEKLAKHMEMVSQFHWGSWQLLHHLCKQGAGPSGAKTGIGLHDCEEALRKAGDKRKLAAGGFSDRWLSPSPKNEAFNALLLAPLIDGAPYTAGDLIDLLQLRLEAAKQLSSKAKSCPGTEYIKIRNRTKNTRWRWACTAYSTGGASRALSPWLDVRVVWNGTSNRSKPLGVQYTLVFPANVDRKSYLGSFIKALMSAYKKRDKRGRIGAIECEQPITDGCILRACGRTITVKPKVSDNGVSFGTLERPGTSTSHGVVELWIDNTIRRGRCDQQGQ